MILSYIIGIVCSAILAAIVSLVFLKDNTDHTKNDDINEWPDDNCCHYEGEF